MRTYSLLSALVRFAALAGFAAAFAGAASAADVGNTIRYGIDDEQNINRLPQVIAEREGFFAREGVKLQLVPLGISYPTKAGDQNRARPLSQRDAMANGAIDMSRQQIALLINDVLGGAQWAGVSVVSSNPVYFLAARPEIKSFADLKGKTIAITGPHDGITIWTRKLLAMHALKNEDVKLKAIGGSLGRVKCLQSGECAASSLAQPSVFDALDAGFHVLGITNEVGVPLYQFDIANRAWAAAHRDLVVKYVRATQAAVRFIEDPKNRETVVKVTAAFMKEPEDRARQMLAYIWEPKNRVLPQQAAIDMNGVKAAIALLGAYDVVKGPLPAPERFVDPSYAKAAEP